MQWRTVAVFFVLFFGLPLTLLNAKNAAKSSETGADDKDLCSYLKDIEAKTDADCDKDTLSALKSKDPATFSRKIELAHQRKDSVLKAYEFLNAQPPSDQKTFSEAENQHQAIPTQLQPPINERTFTAWIGLEAKGLKEVYARWLQAQKQELQNETTGPISPERRKEIEATLTAYEAKISALMKIKDAGELSCFLGEICGSKPELSDPSGHAVGAGKGAWTNADYKKANTEAGKQNLVPGGKIDRGVPLGAIASEAAANTPLGPLNEKPAGDESVLGTVATMTLAATGALMLFGGLGGKQLEEKIPNIRRNMGIAAAVSGTAAVVAVSWPALETAIAAAPNAFSVSGPAIPQLSLAGGGTMGGGAGGAIALEQASVGAIKLALVTSGAKLASDGYNYSKLEEQSDSSTGQQTTTPGENASSSRKKPAAKDAELQRVIDQLFQPTDQYPGGTAGAVRYEQATGKLLSTAGHSQKAAEGVKRLNKILQRDNLNPVDRATAEAMRDHLLNALKIAKRSGP